MNTEQKIMNSKIMTRIMLTIAIIAGIIIVFYIGVQFGYKKAEFIEHMSDGYYRAFGPNNPHEGGAFGYFFDDQTSTHGVAGKIITTSNNKIIIEDNDGTEKTVLVSTSTLIKEGRKTITTDDIKVDDFAISIGDPNDQGQIVAKIIRLVPPPPEATSTDKDATTTN